MSQVRLAGLCIALTVTVASIAVLPVTHAQDSDDVTVEIGNCRDLKTAEERRACYGARVDEAVQERERSAAPPPPNSHAESADDGTASPRRARRDAEEQPAFVGKISALQPTVPNSYLITLDTGQVWRQTRPKWHPLRVGQDVKIYRTGWGASFRLFVDGLSGYIQVEQAR